MHRTNYVDAIGGGLLAVLGAGTAWYATTHYNLGSVSEMGPAMFPTMLGTLLAFFGLVQILIALGQEYRAPYIRAWSFLFVLLGVIAFGALIRPFGLVPAVVAVSVISSLAELRVSFATLVALPAFLSLLSYLVFKVGIGVQFAAFSWPF